MPRNAPKSSIKDIKQIGLSNAKSTIVRLLKVSLTSNTYLTKILFINKNELYIFSTLVNHLWRDNLGSLVYILGRPPLQMILEQT